MSLGGVAGAVHTVLCSRIWIRSSAAFALTSPAGIAAGLFLDRQTCSAHPEFDVLAGLRVEPR